MRRANSRTDRHTLRDLRLTFEEPSERRPSSRRSVSHGIHYVEVFPSTVYLDPSTPRHLAASFGNQLPGWLRVPSSWSLTTSTVFSRSRLRACCIPLRSWGSMCFRRLGPRAGKPVEYRDDHSHTAFHTP